MGDKIGVSGGTLILGFTAWLWLLPAACLYTGHTITYFFDGILKLSIQSGAIILAFLMLLTSVIGMLNKQLSFIVEKIFVGPTSSPNRWYVSSIGRGERPQWNHAQKQSWASPQAHKDFESSTLAVEFSSTLALSAVIAIGVFLLAAIIRVWPEHFALLASVATVALVLGVVSWWFCTAKHLGMVRVASEIENSQGENKTAANPAFERDAAKARRPSTLR